MNNANKERILKQAPDLGLREFGVQSREPGPPTEAFPAGHSIKHPPQKIKTSASF